MIAGVDARRMEARVLLDDGGEARVPVSTLTAHIPLGGAAGSA